jgi:hypothetical protein
MKSESGESPKQLPMVQGSAEVYDFLYVDRTRISALYAQLFPQGLLTGLKTTAQQTFSDEGGVGSDIKILKVENKTTEGGSEGIERMFDTSWSIPLEVLARLTSLSLVRESLRGSGLGSIILADCHLRVIDFASMDNLWEPALKILFAVGQQPQQIIPEASIPAITEVMKAMPHSVHAHFLANDGFLWSSLQPASLTIPTSDLTLKYGGTVSGQWKVLYILDAWPDTGEPPDIGEWSGGPMIDGILTAMHGLRAMMGRPPGWVGVTPLMIYRSIRGWQPTLPSTD